MTLKIQSLNKTYSNGVHAISNVSLEMPVGLFGLLGPNGAGKSSLMRTIATLQEPDSGSIIFNDVDVLKHKNYLRQQLGYLPQDFGFYPKSSAIDLLNHFAILKGITNKSDRQNNTHRLLVLTNLWESRNRALGTFSGGMRQRFGIAQALLGQPKLVIIDEPTVGLDPDERNRFLNLLSEISENITVILSTHIVADVEQLCQRIAIVSKGQVIHQGDTKSSIELLKNNIWQKSIEKNEIEKYKNQYSVLSSLFFSGKPIIRVFSEINPEDGFIQIEPNLEDVYFLRLHQKPSGN